jgi:thiol-disulfide isomerase/thioredoxin
MKIIASILIYLCCIISAYADTPGEIKIGARLPEAMLQGLVSKSKKLSEYRGKPLVINVWASWCGPCRDEMSSIERLARRFGGKKFNVIGISTDDDSIAAANFIQESKLTFNNYIDHDLQLENMLGANTIPLTILVDANGRVLKKVRGSQTWDSAKLLSLLSNTFNIELK